MALTHSDPAAIGSLAHDFNLLGVDGSHYSLESFRNSKALVIVFMCNHCPYVIAVQDRINTLAKEYGSQGVSLIGINSNDSTRYPDDSFEAMKIRAREKEYAFPYVIDPTQSVARAYGAVCTPDFYVYRNEGGKFVLSYRGRLDDNWKDERAVSRRDLALALDSILVGGQVNPEQPSSMGCSIKWKQ